MVRELPDRRRLPRPVDADHEDHARPFLDVHGPRIAEQGGRLLDERLGQIAGHTPRLQPPDELGGGRNSHVGGDQRLLEPLPGLLVARVEGGFGDLVGERPPALAQRVAQAPEEAFPLLLGLLRALVVTEELGPATCHRGTLATCPVQTLPVRARGHVRCQAPDMWCFATAASR